MSLMVFHRRRVLRASSEPVVEPEWNFDTLGTSSTDAFLIERSSDSMQRLFTYGEIQDGTYDTWLGAATGGIIEWHGEKGLMKNGDVNLIRLIANSGNPYLDDWDLTANLGMIQTIDMSGDWIVTLIMADEQNNNNQRLNLGIRGSGSNLIGVQLSSGGTGYIVIDKLTGSTGTADYQFPFTNDLNFKLMTFSRIAGVFKVHINDTEVALSGSTYYTTTIDLPENGAVLGSRKYPDSSSGKVTKYQHAGLLTGTNAANTNISTHNQSIMSKYGIT